MDIIASHQSGLADQLEGDAVALAGRPRDGAQRTIVYHHVADMMGLRHVYALLAAGSASTIDRAIEAMRRAARRARLRLSHAERAAAEERVVVFGETLRTLDALRCASVLGAYRLVATPGLGGEAARRIDGDLLAALGAAQAPAATEAIRRRLFEAQALVVEALIGARLDAAVEVLAWPLGPRAVDAAVAALRLPVDAFAQAERRGLMRIEASLRRSPLLPPQFAANPAQAFFQLQRQVAERRRRAADGDHLSPDEAVSLAA